MATLSDLLNGRGWTARVEDLGFDKPMPESRLAEAYARAPLHAPSTLSASVPLADGSTLGVLIGRWLEYALMLGGLVAVGWAWRRA